MTISSDNTAPSVRSVLRSPALLLASWFGVGLSPRAPGTAGSIAALPLVALLVYYLPVVTTAIIGLLLFFVGVWSASEAGRRWGQADHGAIVIDEVVGQLLATAIPVYVLGDVLASFPVVILLSLVTFRLFDIVKVWPADYVDKHSKNGWGVMLDDVFAGLWAGVVVIALLLMTY